MGFPPVCRYFWTLLTVLLVMQTLGAQTRLFRLYDSGQITRLEAMIENDDFNRLEDSDARFIQALFEMDAKAAVDEFKELIRVNSDSREMAVLIERVAQHQFAAGLYNTARTTFQFLANNFRRSAYGEKGLYFVARCWQAIGRADSSQKAMDTLRRHYSRSDYPALLALDLSQTPPEAMVQDADPMDHVTTYAVQTGAFSTDNNARIQKQFLENKGYRAEIYVKRVEGRRFYVVCVGSYGDRQHADNDGQLIKRRYRIDYQLVDLDELQRNQR